MATVTMTRLFIDGEWQDAAAGEALEATQPGHRRVARRRRRRATARTPPRASPPPRAFPGWARLTAFERAARCTRSPTRSSAAATSSPARSRSTRASRCTPRPTTRSTSSSRYWRMAAEDAKRLEGDPPNSSRPASACCWCAAPRGRSAIITPWNWPYTMPAELLAPALAAGNTVVWTPAPTTAVCSGALAECIAEADLPPGVFNLVTGPGPVVGDEIVAQPGHARRRLHRLDRDGPPVAQRAAGKALLLEMGGNGPLVVMDDADLDARRRGRDHAPASCAPARAARPASACSSTRPCATTSSTGSRERAPRRSGSATRSTTRRRWARSTTRGVAAKMDEHVPTRSTRGAAVVAGGERADGFPTDLYWPATVLDGVPADARPRPRRRSARSRRSSRSARSTRRSS